MFQNSVQRVFTRLVLLLAAAFVATGLLSCAGPATAETHAAVSAPVSMQCLDLDGKTRNPDVDLSAGKPVVLVFWQSWCGSCVAEAPHVEQARRRFGDRIGFYGVVSGPDQAVDEAAVRKVVFQHQLKYPQMRDRDGALSKHFGVQSTPTVVIIGSDRQVLYSEHHLPESWDWLLTE